MGCRFCVFLRYISYLLKLFRKIYYIYIYGTVFLHNIYIYIYIYFLYCEVLNYIYFERLAGILKEWFVQPILDDFYSNITEAVDNEWKAMNNGRNISETIKDYLVTYLGKPINKLIR